MANTEKIKKLIAAAVKDGALDAKRIRASSVVVSHWVRFKCRFGCSGYHSCLTCPPYSPAPEETALVLGEYKSALLLHGSEHSDLTKVVVKLERKAFLEGYYKALAFGAGPWMPCRTCTLRLGACRHPEDARPSMEACGVDVYQTARKNGFPINVVRTERSRQNYYALLLLE